MNGKTLPEATRRSRLTDAQLARMRLLTPEEIQAIAAEFIQSILREDEAALQALPRTRLRDKIIKQAQEVRAFRLALADPKSTTSFEELTRFCLKRFTLAGRLYTEFFDYHTPGDGEEITENVDYYVTELINRLQHTLLVKNNSGNETLQLAFLPRDFLDFCIDLTNQLKAAHKNSRTYFRSNDPALYDLLSKYAVQIESLADIFLHRANTFRQQCKQRFVSEPLQTTAAFDMQQDSAQGQVSTAQQTGPSFFQTATKADQKSREGAPVSPTTACDEVTAILQRKLQLERTATAEDRRQAVFLLHRFLGRQPSALEKSQVYALLAQIKIDTMKENTPSNQPTCEAEKPLKLPPVAVVQYSGLSRIPVPSPDELLNILFPKNPNEALSEEIKGISTNP